MRAEQPGAIAGAPWSGIGGSATASRSPIRHAWFHCFRRRLDPGWVDGGLNPDRPGLKDKEEIMDSLTEHFNRQAIVLLIARFPHRSSGQELFPDDPFFQVVFRVEQQGRRDVAVLAHHHLLDIPHLGEIGDGADRAGSGV